MKLALACANDSTADVNLFLQKSYKEVSLMVRGKDTDPDDYWYLLSITKDGKIILHGSLPKSIGLPLDEKGRVMLGESA